MTVFPGLFETTTKFKSCEYGLDLQYYRFHALWYITPCLLAKAASPPRNGLTQQAIRHLRLQPVLIRVNEVRLPYGGARCSRAGSAARAPGTSAALPGRRGSYSGFRQGTGGRGQGGTGGGWQIARVVPRITALVASSGMYYVRLRNASS
jgi:hypothetical protein